MSKDKVKVSIFFEDSEKKHRFLFRLVNIGKRTDELKFSFNTPTDSKVVIYTDKGQKYPDDSLIRSYGEITYHTDGSLLYKYPETKKEPDTIRKNPHGTGSRRTPLNALEEWEPVIMGNIIRYQDCIIGSSDDERLIPYNQFIFNGNPFEYLVYLGNKKFLNPPNNGQDELIFRLNNVAQNVDMNIWVRKSDYYGEEFQFGSTTAWKDLNRIRVIEPRLIAEDGALQIDLKKLKNSEWYGDVVDDNLSLQLHNLRTLAPMSPFCKSYLKNNPYLNQIIQLVGFNKGFSVSLLFNGIPLNLKMMGILEKDAEGEFLGIGSLPLSK
jgi:hypothetical protein